MDKFFKVSALTAAMMGAVVAAPAMAEDPVGPVYAESVSEFFSESTISGNVNFFMRARDRAGMDANGNDTSKVTNLDHGSIFANLGFHSGYVADTIGFDTVIYSTFDMWAGEDTGGSFEHEMNFFDCDSPYGAGDSCDSYKTDNGVSFASAALKFKFGENFNAKLGYFQPSVPSTLGVNWSFAPGTYRGGQIGANFGKLALGFVYADEYKAPWFKETYEFNEGTFWGGAGKDVGDAYSFGARYALDNGISFDAGYGALTDGDRKNFHFKVKGTTDGGLYWSPQLYVVDDDNQYDSTAFQVALLTSKSMGQYSFRADATYTSADSDDKRGQVGNMAYRLTEQYGGSNGSYDVWWNNRSDFNHDGEYAFFLSASRDFADIGGNGFSAGLSGAYGAGAKASGYDELVEYAYSFFANYAIQGGALKDANISFYYTNFYNDSDAPDWGPYSNAFNDETDFKLILTMPFGVK
ncbi:OprD family porin [Vibrio natriegens]|uniref:multidrug transporter n=1 Tax=Vibrio natriegens TaxID=691 RepID=UPI001594C856|nr:multidrug transporter [Vibrio natriegens]NVC92872.1 OprD family porin [Vibrio natriegens]